MPIIYMVRLLPWVIIQINFTLQHLIYLVLRKTLNCLTEISLTLISYLFQHVSIDLYFSNKVWTLLPWQTMCGNFLMKDKKKWKGLLYASHSTACWRAGLAQESQGRTSRQSCESDCSGAAENACRPRGGRHRGPALSCDGSLPSCALPSPATNMHNSG